MKRYSAAVLILSTSMAFAIMAGAANAEEQVPMIHVTGVGTVNVEPDLAILSLGVTREAKTAREALNANSQAMADVLATMQEAGIEERDLQTSNFSIQPQYRYPKSSDTVQVPTIIGYVVRNNLTVRVRNLDIVGEVLDASVTLGVNDGGNISFGNDDPKSAIAEARAAAMVDAIEKAETLTEAGGIELGDIIVINEQSRIPSPRPMARMEMAAMADSAAPVPIASGQNSYTVTVNVSFELEQ